MEGEKGRREGGRETRATPASKRFRRAFMEREDGIAQKQRGWLLYRLTLIYSALLRRD